MPGHAMLKELHRCNSCDSLGNVLAELDWRTLGGCRTLTAEQADSIFFPGSGGKPTKAKSFCGSVNCPVMDKCLVDAIENNLEGFWAGTTKEERGVMAQFFHITPKSYDDLMPPEPERKRKVYRKIDDSGVQTTLDFLDAINAPF